MEFTEKSCVSLQTGYLLNDRDTGIRGSKFGSVQCLTGYSPVNRAIAHTTASTSYANCGGWLVKAQHKTCTAVGLVHRSRYLERGEGLVGHGERYGRC